MSTTPQRRALRKYRSRLRRRGLTRFEVLGRDTDRELIRSLAKCLTADDAQAKRMRTTLRQSIAGGGVRKGGILAGLRRSPLVGAHLRVRRPFTPGRPVQL